MFLNAKAAKTKINQEVKYMADENKGVALAVLGIVAVLAIVGLVLLFTGEKATTGQVISTDQVAAADQAAVTADDTAAAATGDVARQYVGDYGAYVADPTPQYCTDSDYLRGRCIPGSGSTSGEGPRYQSQAGGAPIEQYNQGRYGIVPSSTGSTA